MMIGKRKGFTSKGAGAAPAPLAVNPLRFPIVIGVPSYQLISS